MSIRTTKRFALVSSGIVLATILIGMALALVIVQISTTVASNEFIPPTTTSTSTTTTIPQGDGLQAAISSSGGGPSSCNTAFNGSVVALGSISFDLNIPSAQSYSPQKYLCVTNVGPGTINTLNVTAGTASSGEAGCSVAEGTADPEGATCGSAGELDTVLEFILTPFNLQDADCIGGQIPVALGATQSLLSTGGGGQGLNTGAICSWEVRLQFVGTPSDQAKLAASTDTGDFTLDVSGSGL